jgi:hypothetical protein
MKIKLLFFFLLALISFQDVFSQSGRKDVIYLKNGSVIKGIIIEQVPGKSYKIQTADNNVFTYQVDEVEKITVEMNPSPSSTTAPAVVTSPTPTSIPVKKGSEFKNKGWSGIVKLGPLGLRSFTGSVTGGYNFEGFIFMGLGVSADAYRNIGQTDQQYPIDGVDVLMPIYLDFRMFSSQKRFAFMWNIDMGYAPLANSAIHYQNSAKSMDSYNKTTKGGAYYATGIGLRAFATNSVAVLLEFGLKIQNYTVDEHRTNNVYTYNNITGTSSFSYATQSVNESPKTTVTPYINFGLKF